MLLIINSRPINSNQMQGAERFLHQIARQSHYEDICLLDAQGQLQVIRGNAPKVAAKLKPNWLKLFNQDEQKWHYLLLQLAPEMIYIGNLANVGIAPILAAKQAKLPYSLIVFDYWYFCPKATLFNNGQHCEGFKSFSECANCVIHESTQKTKQPNLFNKLSTLTPLFSWLVFSLYCLVHGHFSIFRQFNQRKQFHQDIFADAQKVYFLSASAQQQYQQHFKLSQPSQIIKTPARIEVKQSEQSSSVKPSNRQLTIGYIGAIDFHKGVDLIFAAIDKLNAQQAIPSDVTIQLAGQANTQFLPKLTEFKSFSQATLLGFLDTSKLAEFYQQIDFLVIPSRCPENRPQVLVDAIDLGTPTIISDMPGLCELVDDPRFQFKTNNADSLSEKILLFIQSNPDRAAFKRFAINNTGITCDKL